MKKGILINENQTKKLFILDNINNEEIFHFVGQVQKVLCQRSLSNAESIVFAMEQQGFNLHQIKLVAEININKQSLDY